MVRVKVKMKDREEGGVGVMHDVFIYLVGADLFQYRQFVGE